MVRSAATLFATTVLTSLEPSVVVENSANKQFHRKFETSQEFHFLCVHFPLTSHGDLPDNKVFNNPKISASNYDYNVRL